MQPQRHNPLGLDFQASGKSATHSEGVPTIAPPVKSFREFVRDALLDRIARGDLAEGQRVVEAALVAEFAISATPVREAIRELVAMGVLDAQNNKGAFVRKMQLAETIEAFEVRAALETVAARAAASLLKGRCEEIRVAAKAIVESAKIKDFAAFQAHNQTFHRAIVAGAGNGVLLKLWDTLFFQIRTRWTMDYLQTFDPVAIALEHIPIVDALDSGMPDLAASLMASHSAHLVTFLKAEHSARCGISSPPSLR